MDREPVEDVSSGKAADLKWRREDGDAVTGTIAIVVLTYNRIIESAEGPLPRKIGPSN